MPRRKPTKKRAEAAVPVEETLKEKGNKAFAAQKFEESQMYFTKAINEVEMKGETNHVLFSNRSATRLALKEFTAALEDAERTIEIKGDWPKGYFRKGHALEGLLQFPEAFAAYNEGLKHDAEDPALTKAHAELLTLMEELKLTEAEMKMDNPDEDKFVNMCNWMRDGGAKFPKLYLQFYSEDYRGCHSLTKIPPDDVILYVPHKYVMTSEVAKASKIGKHIIASPVELRSKHSYLASYLLQEKHKGKESFWYPYLAVLPEKYANMPLFFDEDMLALLKGSFSLQKIADRIDSLRREYDNIRRAVPAFSQFTHEEFVWARLVVITRIFGLVIKGNKTDGLAPYADMLNHKVPKETSWTFDDNRYGLIITSLKTIQRGEQVFDSYGRKCNSRFFVNYGFALDDNEDNEAVIRVELPANDAHKDMKQRFLGGAKYSRREFQIPGRSYREKKTKELFSFMRLIKAKDSELMLLSSGDGFKLEEIQPISIRNEIAVLEGIKKACLESLALFDHSLEHDEKLVASGELAQYSNERNCVVMRRGEKRVLTWFINLADNSIPFLKKPWKDLKRIAAKCYQGTSGLDTYVTSVVVPLVKKAT